MKKNCLIILLSCLSCSGQKTNESVNFVPDVFISNISVLDTTNVTTILGEDVMLNLEGTIIKKASFSNIMQNETLEVIFQPGSYLNEFSKFIVFKSKNDVSKPQIDIQNFVTESGIELGIDKKTLISLKGKPTSITQFISSEIYEYVIDNYDSSCFLEKYKMPIYRAKYFFENSKLVRFEFGFDYP